VPPPGGAPNAPPISLNALLASNVVLVIGNAADGRSKLGSGFFVSNDRIVTNRRVVQGLSSIQVTNKALGQAIPAQLVAVSAPADVPISAATADFALLSVNAAPRNFLSLGPSPARSSNVIAVGYPASQLRTDADFLAFVNGNNRSAPDSVIQSGRITQLRDRDPVKYLTHSAPLGRGNGGGPLVDYCGRVVGVNTLDSNDDEQSATTNQAQDVSELRAFLERNGVTPRIDEAQKPCPPAATPPGPAARAGSPSAPPSTPGPSTSGPPTSAPAAPATPAPDGRK
jgi:S1-C subfamily serine protease